MDLTRKNKALQNFYIKLKIALSETGIKEEIIGGKGPVNCKLAIITDVPYIKASNKEHDVSKDVHSLLCGLGVDEKDTYITGAVKFRPTAISSKTGKPVGRPPSKIEAEFCAPFLFEELKIIEPSIAVTLGRLPLMAVTGDSTVRLKDFHGKLIEISHLIICPMYEPKSALYIKELQQIYEHDVDSLKQVLSKIK